MLRILLLTCFVFFYSAFTFAANASSFDVHDERYDLALFNLQEVYFKDVEECSRLAKIANKGLQGEESLKSQLFVAHMAPMWGYFEGLGRASNAKSKHTWVDGSFVDVSAQPDFVLSRRLAKKSKQCADETAFLLLGAGFVTFDEMLRMGDFSLAEETHYRVLEGASTIVLERHKGQILDCLSSFSAMQSAPSERSLVFATALANAVEMGAINPEILSQQSVEFRKLVFVKGNRPLLRESASLELNSNCKLIAANALAEANDEKASN